MKIKQIIKQLFCKHKDYTLEGSAETGKGGIIHGFGFKKKCCNCCKKLELSSAEFERISKEIRMEINIQEGFNGNIPKEVSVTLYSNGHHYYNHRGNYTFTL